MIKVNYLLITVLLIPILFVSFETSALFSKYNNKVELLDVAAYVCTNKGLYEESNDILNKILKQSIDNNDSINTARYYNNIGINYFAQQKYDLAKYNFESALSYCNNFESGVEDNCAENNLGILFIRNGNYSEGLKRLQKALKPDAEDTEVGWERVIGYNLGQYYLKSNMKDSAIACFFSDKAIGSSGLNMKAGESDYRLCYLLKEENLPYCKSLNESGLVDSTFFGAITFYNEMQVEIDSLVDSGEMKMAYELTVKKTMVKDEIVKHINDAEYDVILESFVTQKSNTLQKKKLFGGLTVLFSIAIILLLILGVRQRRKMAEI